MNLHHTAVERHAAVTTDLLDDLAARIDADGVDAVATSTLAAIAAAATGSGASPVLGAIVVDPAASPAARNRAFGRLALHLANHRGATRFIARSSPASPVRTVPDGVAAVGA